MKFICGHASCVMQVYCAGKEEVMLATDFLLSPQASLSNVFVLVGETLTF